MGAVRAHRAGGNTPRHGKPHPEQDQIGGRCAARVVPGKVARGARRRASQTNGCPRQHPAYRPTPLIFSLWNTSFTTFSHPFCPAIAWSLLIPSQRTCLQAPDFEVIL